jgi:hypothetical protein
MREAGRAAPRPFSLSFCSAVCIGLFSVYVVSRIGWVGEATLCASEASDRDSALGQLLGFSQ